VEGQTGNPGGNGGGGADGGAGAADENPFSGAAVASKGAKLFAIAVLLLGVVYCTLVAGLGEVSRNLPFQTDANFALLAAFVVVAGAIERIIQPLTAVLPPFSGPATLRAKANRTLVAYGIALIVGIAVSSLFGLYFLETMGVKIGAEAGTGEAARWVFANDGDKVLRGLDVFLTALIITGGTKSLHDTITSIEKKKDTLKKSATAAVEP
jgi:hypothetical protein